MRKQLFILFLILITNLVHGQKLTMEINEYEVYQEYELNHGHRNMFFVDTLHLNKNLKLNGWFSISNMGSSRKHPVLKGQFNDGRLVDTLISIDYLVEKNQFKGQFIPTNSNSDTFRLLHIYPAYYFSFLGTANGVFNTTKLNGEPERINSYLNGKLEGEQIQYEKSKIWNIENYKNGVKDGFCINYNFYDDTINTSRFVYPEFKEAGKFAKIPELNRVHYIDEYENGNLISSNTYYIDGSKYEKTLDNNGKILAERKYFYNGKLKEKLDYINGLKEGDFEEYYENGQSKIKGTYLHDSLEGPFIAYHENGKIMEKGNFKRGELVKGFKKYDDEGKYIGFWSYYGNLPESTGGVINGAYIDERYKGPRNYYDMIFDFPSAIFQDKLTTKEIKLLKKYPQLSITVTIFTTENSFLESYGLITINNEELKLSEKKLSELHLILNDNLKFKKPFLINNGHSSCEIKAIVKFEENNNE